MAMTQVYSPTTAPHPTSSCFTVPSEHLDKIRFVIKLFQVIYEFTVSSLRQHDFTVFRSESFRLPANCESIYRIPCETPPLTFTMTTITKVGGVVVVTQVIPQEESSIPLQTGAPASQAPPPATKAPPTAPTKLNGMTAAFLRGEPQGLGVVQIVIGVLCILFSVTAVYSPALIFHVPLCATVSFVVSGSLVVAAARRTSVRLVQVSLVWNVISAVVGVVAVAYVCWLLAAHPPAAWFCETEVFRGEVPTDHEWVRCVNMMRILNVPMYGPLGLLLVLLILQVCVTVAVCVFSVKAVRSHKLYSPVQVEVDDCHTLLVGAASAHDSDVGLLDGDGDETLTSPPDSP